MSDIANDLDWSEIFTVYHPKIRKYIYRRTSDQMLTDDLASTTFVRAIEASKAGKGSTSSFSGWLFRIAHNLVLDHYRGRDRLPETVELDARVPNQTEEQTSTYGEMITSTMPTPHDLTVQSMTVHVVQKTINRLTPEQSYVVREYMDLRSFKDIAVDTESTYGATKALRQRGLVTMRLFLAKEVV